VKERASSRSKRTRGEHFIKENMEEAKVKDCYNINKDQVLVEMEGWSGKESETKGKT
jgi:hypothetical protein